MPQWQISPLLRLSWRDWGAESVVFDATSGQTHLFDRLTAAVAASIAEHPSSAQDLCQRLGMDAGLETPMQLLPAIEQVVERLRVMGWVRTIGP